MRCKKMRRLEHLFSPIRIGSMELRNRIFMPAMASLSAEDSSPSDATISYYGARAKGGVGLIILEITAVHATTKWPNLLALDDDNLIPRWRGLASAVHAHGAKVWCQLWHAGRQSARIDAQPIAASAIPCPMTKKVPKEMTKEDIETIVEAYGEAARRGREAGLDGIELHGAHGYLICNFMSPWSNKRTDEYGGSLMNRLRFTLEIINRIRAKCGNDFPIGIRLSYNEMVEGGLLPEEMEIVCSILTEAGVDALNISRGNYGVGSYRWLIPPAGVPVAAMASSSERVKKLVDIPIMVAHRIHDPIIAEYVLAQGKADLIGMGRALIADPELPKKAEAGHFEDIIPCIACNQGCQGNVMRNLMITCTLNPTVARERELAFVPAQKPKKVLVAGGGPAGLEAGRVAALRGHHVTLCEKTHKLGGQFNLAAVPAAKQEFAKAIQYLSIQVKKAGVKVEMGEGVTPELVDKLMPDVVVVATGSTPIIPADIPGSDKPNVVTAHDLLAGKVTAGDRVVIIGGGAVGCETADYVGERGVRQITVVEMLEDVALDMIPSHKEFLMDRLKGYGVSILTPGKVKEILDDGVVFTRDSKEESIRGVNQVILAMGTEPVSDLLTKIRSKVAEVYIIGDAKKPRKAIDAIHEGAEIARKI